jgi:hypothetical protein
MSHELAPLLYASAATRRRPETPFQAWLRMAREHQATARFYAQLARDPRNMAAGRHEEVAEDNFAMARNCMKWARGCRIR